jgi:RNA polymerase sigma factor (sigma-70 family)
MPAERPDRLTPLASCGAGTCASDVPEPRAEVLTRLFQEHNQELIGFLCTRLRSEQDAKEVAQEAYARLLRLDQPGAVSMLRAYLFKIAANLAIDRIRHRTTRDAVHQKLGHADDRPDEPTPEQVAANRQEAQRVIQHLRELPERCRQAFLLYRVYELNLQEVAAEMNVTDRMVRYYVIRAMTHVRARLDAAAAAGKEQSP